MKTLVVGYGSELRSDDGLGPAVARSLSALCLPDVVVRTAHQLNPEIVNEMKSVERVIFVDASESGEDIALEELVSTRKGQSASSHHLDVSWLKELCTALAGVSPVIFLCSIKGENFDFGLELSPSAKNRLARAVEELKKLISGGYSNA